MKHQAGLSIFALAVATSAAPTVAAQTSNASILFTRTNYVAFDGSSDTVLYRVKPSGDNVVPLTPATLHVDYRNGSWSPRGGSIAYEAVPQAATDPSQLYVVDRQGGSTRQVTTGPYGHQQASWGPGGIAFVTNLGNQKCLSIVRANGSHQHDLFCPPTAKRRYAQMSTPQWSRSGKSVYIEVGIAGIGLEPQWYSRVYRVNVTTGAAVMLTEQVFGDPDTGGDPQSLTIAPDGKHGVYADEETDQLPMQLVDFTTGTRTALPVTGYMPRYSKDGRKVAFIRNDHVFVMRADSTHVRPAMTHPGTNAYYRIADWSADGKRILVDKIASDRLLQIVTLSTGEARTVTKGTAGKGAWFQP